MRRVQFRLGGVDADLPEGGNAAPALVLQLAELGKTASIVGDGAKRSVKLPATAINRAALATGRADCVVVVDGVQVFTGTAIVSERNNIRGRQQTVSINLVSGNVSALGAVFDVRLADLDWSDTEHDLTSFAVVTGLGYATPLANQYGYNPVMRGRWSISGQVQHYECTPFILLGAAIERALQQIAGYTLDSNFLKDSIFKGLCMPVLLPEKYGDDFARDYTQETWEVISYNVPVGASELVRFETPVYTNPNNLSWDTIDEYTCPYDGFYNMKIQLIVEQVAPITGVMQVAFSPRQNGVNYNVQYPGANLQVNFFIPTTGQTIVSLDVVFEANAGDVLSLLVFMPASGQIKLVSGRIDIVGEAKIQSGSPIFFKYLLGDTTVGDIVRGLTHAFNLVWATNQFARTVQTEPADDWYNARTAQIESGFYSQTETQNLPEDLSREQKISYFQAPKSWMFGYETDDQTAEAIDKAQQMPSFSARFDFANPASDKVENEENPTFAKTLMFFDEEIKTNSVTFGQTPSIPLIYGADINENRNAPIRRTAKPRLLILTPPTNIAGVLDAGGFNFEGAGRVLFPCFSVFANASPLSLGYPNLSYSDIVTNGVLQKGLLSVFYAQTLQRLSQGETSEEYRFLPLSAVLNFHFQKKLYRDGIRWIIHKVDAFNPLSRTSTKVQLLRDAIPSETGIVSSSTPISANINPSA